MRVVFIAILVLFLLSILVVKGAADSPLSKELEDAIKGFNSRMEENINWLNQSLMISWFSLSYPVVSLVALRLLGL